MSDFGARLRQARERRGISLRQIAASTKISVAALEALERNDVSKLPGGIFSRAFVRSYATEVGLDPDGTVREFLQRFEELPPAEAPSHVPYVPQDESDFERRQRIAKRVLKLVTIGVPLVAALLYFTLRSRASLSSSGGRVSGAAAPANEITSASAEARTPATSPPAPASASPATDAPVARAAAPGPSPAIDASVMRLEIRANGPCWVSLVVDGKKVFARVLQAGERDTRSVQNDAIVEVGDAGAFAFTVDGREGRPLGRSGQVRTLKLTRATLAQYVK